MSNQATTLKQSVLTRYAKAMQNAQIEEWRIVVRPDGTHEIVAGKRLDTVDIANDWD